MRNNTPTNAGDPGSIPGSERPPGEGSGNPLQYSCLGNPMDRGTWRPVAHGVPKSCTWLSDWALKRQNINNNKGKLSSTLEFLSQRISEFSFVWRILLLIELLWMTFRWKEGWFKRFGRKPFPYAVSFYLYLSYKRAMNQNESFHIQAGLYSIEMTTGAKRS